MAVSCFPGLLRPCDAVETLPPDCSPCARSLGRLACSPPVRLHHPCIRPACNDPNQRSPPPAAAASPPSPELFPPSSSWSCRTCPPRDLAAWPGRRIQGQPPYRPSAFWPGAQRQVLIPLADDWIEPFHNPARKNGPYWLPHFSPVKISVSSPFSPQSGLRCSGVGMQQWALACLFS